VKFSDFENVEQVIAKYPLELRQERFLPEEASTELPEWFTRNLRFLLDMKSVDENEAFLSEGFVFPFLQEAWQRHRKLKLWSHRALAYGTELYGEPDYLISALPEGVVERLINKPLLAVTEAKKEDFTKGWAQCLSGMIACQKLNQRADITVYGIVSTGIIWEFGKLEGNAFVKHPLPYSISEPGQVLALIDFVFSECEKELGKAS
jgi:hypothetical protein